MRFRDEICPMTFHIDDGCCSLSQVFCQVGFASPPCESNCVGWNKEGVQESWFGESATQWPEGWRTRSGRALSCLPKDVWINWELPCCPDHSYVMNLSFTFPRRWDRWLAHRCGELSEIPVAQRHMTVRAGPEDRWKSMRWWWRQVSCLSETNDHSHLSSWIRWSGWQMAVNVYLW